MLMQTGSISVQRSPSLRGPDCIRDQLHTKHTANSLFMSNETVDKKSATPRLLSALDNHLKWKDAFRKLEIYLSWFRDGFNPDFMELILAPDHIRAAATASTSIYPTNTFSRSSSFLQRAVLLNMQLQCRFPGNELLIFFAAHLDLLGLIFVSDWVSLLGRRQHISEGRK